jgi:hypothetical protein
LELKVFDSQGNVVASQVFSNQNQNGGGVYISFFDLNAAQLPASAFDNTGRAQLTGLIKSVDPTDPSGVVASGEIFKIGDGRSLIHIAGTEMLRGR